jgi:hypothetical protein
VSGHDEVAVNEAGTIIRISKIAGARTMTGLFILSESDAVREAGGTLVKMQLTRVGRRSHRSQDSELILLGRTTALEGILVDCGKGSEDRAVCDSRGHGQLLGTCIYVTEKGCP